MHYWFSAIIVAAGLLSSRLTPIGQQGVTRPAIAQAPATRKPAPPADAALPQSDIPDGYIIARDDSIQVTVWKEPALSGTLLVRPDGMVTLPLLGDVSAAGLAKLYTLYDSMRYRRTDAALIRLITPVREDESPAQAHERLVGFANHLNPLLSPYIPN